LKEELSVMYGLSCSRHPSAFTSLSVSPSDLVYASVPYQRVLLQSTDWCPCNYGAMVWQLGRSKTNGEVRSSGVVITMEAPLDNMGRPSLSVQLNGGFEFWSRPSSCTLIV
jgi:hypothetical protein